MNTLQKSIWLIAVVTLSACGAGSTQQSPGFSPGNGPAAGTPPFSEKARNIADQLAVEGYAFSLQTSDAFSADSNRINRYEALNLPAGLSINAATGEITGTTGEVGVHDVIVTAIYDNGEELDTDFRLTVEENDAPTLIEPIDDMIVATGQPATISVADNFSDPEGGALRFTVTGLPDGMTFDPASGEISGVPTVAGDYEITVTATDEAGESVSDVFLLTVADDNAAPAVVQPIPAQTATQGYAKTIETAASFNDPEGGELTYSAAGLPEGMSINMQTGAISGTPTVPGDYDVTVTATDPEGAMTSSGFPLRVNPNQAPVVNPPLPDRAEQTGNMFSYDTGSNFSDPEGGALTFAATGLPVGASIDPQTGVITGTAGLDGTVEITVTATDQVGASLSDSFQLIIGADNQPPQNTSAIPDQTAAADQQYTFDSSDHFSDPEGGALSYSASGLPDGVSIDPDSGVISGTPTVPGDYTIAVTATDADGATVSDDFVLTVEPSGEPALVSPIEDEDATAGQPKSITTAEHFNDPDGQPLTYSATGLPDGMSIDSQTGEISGTPTVPGDYPVVVTATDPDGNAISDEFDLTVEPAVEGSPMLVSPIEDETATAGEPKTVTTAEHFSDPDGQPLTFSATGIPDGMAIDPQTGEISGTPTTPGDYIIVVVATDPDGNSVEDSFNMQVAAGNQAPQVVSPIEDESAVQGYPVMVTTAEHFADPDGDTLTFSAVGLPTGLTIDPQTGEITGAAEEAAVFSVEVIATDPQGGSVSDTFTLNVAVNESPQAGAQPAPRTAAANEPYEQDTSEDFGDDPEGGALTYSSSELPPGLTINPETGVISGEPTEPGQYSYSVMATDPGGASATQVYNLTIVPALQAVDDLTPTNQDTPVTIDVLANDMPTANATKAVTAITVEPRFGEVVIGTGGQNVVYTPFSGSILDDEFVYQISDGVGTSEATVSVFVIPGRVIYRSNVDVQNFQLYAANSGDNEFPATLTPAPLPAVSSGVQPIAEGYGYDVHEPSGTAVYIADQQFTEVFEVWSIDLNSAVVPLSQQRLSRLPPDDVTPLDDAPDLNFSPDGLRVVYRSNAGLSFTGLDLYVVSLAAPGQPELAHPTLDYLTYDGEVENDYQWLADSSAVIFRANLEASDKRELYKADLQGSQGISKLHPPLPAGTEVKKFVVSPDGSFLVYRVNVNGENFDTLKLVDLNAQLPNSVDIDVRLDNSSGAVVDDGLTFSPNGRWLLLVGSANQAVEFRPYSIDLDQLATGPELVELWSNDVSTPLVTDSNNEWVYFMARLEGVATQELFRVALSEPGVVEKVSADFNDEVATGVRNFVVADNASVVAYVADHDFATQNELYMVQLDGLRQRVKLNGDDFTAVADVQNDMAFTNDSDKVIYIADPGGVGRKELFVVDLSYPGETFKISQTMQTLLDQVEDFYITP